MSGRDHQFVVVHNGIITNFRPLKNFLVRFGWEGGLCMRLQAGACRCMLCVSLHLCMLASAPLCPSGSTRQLPGSPGESC